MNNLQTLVGNYVEIEISGHNCFHGILIDYGLDILVIFNDNKFYYIPVLHIQHFKQIQNPEDRSEQPDTTPFQDESDRISFRKILQHAKGRFLEIYVTGNKTIHGYVTSIMNDYIAFHSPVYKTLYVSMNHLKWFIPYNEDVTPYTLNHNKIPFYPSNTSLTRTFKEQCKKMEGEFVVFDQGDSSNKIGLLKQVDMNRNLLELVTANGEVYNWNLQHLKTLYVP